MGSCRRSCRDQTVVHEALVAGHQSVLGWLRSLDPPSPWCEQDIAAAAWHKDYAMVRWMRQQDPPCPWDAACISAAATAGVTSAVHPMLTQEPPGQWDVKRRKPFTPDSNFAAIRWMRAQQPPCPWDETCTAAAASAGNLELLRWMRAQDPPCPWDVRGLLVHAISHGDVDMLDWLHGQHCPLDECMYEMAIRQQHPHVLQWLHAAELAKPSFPLRRSIVWSVPVIMVLGDIGYPLDGTALDGLSQARRTFCTFHGLLRWCQRSGAALGQRMRFRPAFSDKFCDRTSSNELLLRLSSLPPELIAKIAVAAQLQPDCFQQAPA